MNIKHIFLIISASSAYIANYKIPTKFKKKSDILEYLTEPTFFFKYLDIVNAQDCIFSPDITEFDSCMMFPQVISYYKTSRKLNFLPNNLQRIKVTQFWDVKDNVFCGNIRTKFIEFDLDIEPVFEENKCYLCFKGEILKKSMIVPSKYLDKVLEEFGDIFTKITA
tara:strand:- start:3729 stop:4226 length:498 start_codon:yes stop_codon:yes gene_type:complete